MRVLVVEEDVALGMFLMKGLQSEGHEVECEVSGGAAFAHAEQFQPELVVLDMGLGLHDGKQILEQMHQRLSETAVLVLTASASVEDRVACLNRGADDCLLKPFSFHELAARCRAILRRRQRFASPELSFGGVTMNLLERSASYNGLALELTSREFVLLEFLVRRRGQSCSRAELLREVWRFAPETGTNVVDVYVTYLRKKLAAAQRALDERDTASLIETVRGAGYRMRVPAQYPAQFAAQFPAKTASPVATFLRAVRESASLESGSFAL